MTVKETANWTLSKMRMRRYVPYYFLRYRIKENYCSYWEKLLFKRSYLKLRLQSVYGNFWLIKSLSSAPPASHQTERVNEKINDCPEKSNDTCIIKFDEISSFYSVRPNSTRIRHPSRSRRWLVHLNPLLRVLYRLRTGGFEKDRSVNVASSLRLVSIVLHYVCEVLVITPTRNLKNNF